MYHIGKQTIVLGKKKLACTTGVSGGAQTGSGTRARVKQKEGTRPSAPNNAVVQATKMRKKVLSYKPKTATKKLEIEGVFLTITLDLLVVSAFSLIKSLKVFKFPNLAATCTAVSPFCRQ